MKKITVDGEEYIREKDCKPLKSWPKSEHGNPFMEIGESYFIRTVTHYFTGRLIWVGEKEICLEEACWIADTGRFHKFISGGEWNESEPFEPSAKVIIGRGSIIDMTKHEPITTVK